MSAPTTGSFGVRARWAAAFMLFFAGWPSSAVAEHLGQGVDEGTSLWRVAGALLVCVAVAIVAALLLKRRMGGGASLFRPGTSRRMQMVECLRMGSQVSVCIVACDGEELLMSVSPQGANLLRSISAPVSQDTGQP